MSRYTYSIRIAGIRNVPISVRIIAAYIGVLSQICYISFHVITLDDLQIPVSVVIIIKTIISIVT